MNRTLGHLPSGAQLLVVDRIHVTNEYVARFVIVAGQLSTGWVAPRTSMTFTPVRQS